MELSAWMLSREQAYRLMKDHFALPKASPDLKPVPPKETWLARLFRNFGRRSVTRPALWERTR